MCVSGTCVCIHIVMYDFKETILKPSVKKNIRLTKKFKHNEIIRLTYIK